MQHPEPLSASVSRSHHETTWQQGQGRSSGSAAADAAAERAVGAVGAEGGGRDPAGEHWRAMLDDDWLKYGKVQTALIAKLTHCRRRRLLGLPLVLRKHVSFSRYRSVVSVAALYMSSGYKVDIWNEAITNLHVSAFL